MAKRENLRDLIAHDMRIGETQAEWCERKGFPLRTLSRLLAASGSVPRSGTIMLLASALGIDPDRIAAYQARAKRE